MADPAALRESLAAALKEEQGSCTLEFALPGRHMAARRRYRLDVEILLPLVSGSVYLERGVRSVDGRVLLRGPHKGEYVFTIQNSPEEVRVEFDLSFSNGLGALATSLLEGLSPHESDDLCRRLARRLVRARAQLDPAGDLCDQLAGAQAPADRLAYAEALWDQARLFLLIGQDRAAAERAAEGAEQAVRSGLPTGDRMFQSGQVLASALNRFNRPEAAKQVRDSLRET